MLFNESDLLELMGKINYNFRNQKYLKRALITRDFADKNDVNKFGHQEALEKYGDSLIGFFAIEKGVKMGMVDKDTLHDYRTSQTKNEFIKEIAVALNLKKYVKWSETQLNQEHWHKDELYADCFEALIGAIYLDGGIKKAKKVFWELVKLIET